MRRSPHLILLLFVFALQLLPQPFARAAGPQTDQADQLDRPVWIWAAGPRDQPQRVELHRAFNLEGGVQRADLRLATECCDCELSIGDERVFRLDDYGPWIDLDVTEHVRSGANQLSLRCDGSEGPSAILLELSLRLIDGRRIVIRSDHQWRGRVPSSETNWHQVATHGMVAQHVWDADRVARITPFDNYEQWRQASDNAEGADPATIFVRPGFEIERVHRARDTEGSWVSMEFDPQGRLIIAREDRGLLRMTLSGDGRTVSQVETIDDTLQECRGLVFLNGLLYAQANNSKSLYRLQDRDGDGTFEIRQQVRAFTGGVGHGRNDLAVGPDQNLYAIFGDSVELPQEQVIDHTSPFREARRGERTTEGHFLRYDPAADQWHLLCSGLRNPFGVDFNGDGEAFTYDADAEFDMGAPWYRPTRLIHLVSGGDYGWRGRTGSWPPYDSDHADFTLPSGDIGKGSPTAVKSGGRSSFPQQYQQAIFALDWAYGRILACHLVPRGAGYVCRPETFLKGQPLNVTDLDFASDGSLYVITGGRKTRSNLYRVRWTGGELPKQEATPQQKARDAFASEQRALRGKLASGFRGQATRADDAFAWNYLGHRDPMIRDAARVALEHLPLAQWQEAAFRESRPAWVIASMLALSRSGKEELVPRILQKLLEVDRTVLSAYDQSMLLETWSRCLASDPAKRSPVEAATIERIDDWYPDVSVPALAPTGAGRSVNHQLSLLLSRVGSPNLVDDTVTWLGGARSQEDRMHAIFVLRNCREGWTDQSRRIAFETLGELDRSAISGEGMPGFLRQIREELIATLNDQERLALGDLIEPGSAVASGSLSIDRPLVRHWQISEIDEILAEEAAQPNSASGSQVFRDALCIQCHRAGGRGGVTGPDLSSVAARFGRGDLLRSILDPSSVVDEKYRNEQIVTTDGRVLVGRIVPGGDYRATTLRIATDPLKPNQFTEIAKNEVESHRNLQQSPMPSGLLDRFTAAEIRNLLNFLERPDDRSQ